MSGKRLVDPQLEPLLELFPTIDFSAEFLAAIRARGFPVLADPLAVAAVDMEVRVIAGPVNAPAVSLRIYTPRNATGLLPCILHMHGGGFVTGSAEMMDPMHRVLAMEENCVIVSIDYRLAPETAFPGAVEDCYAALAWLVAEAASLRVEPSRIGVMGESAGGGLAAALALLTRDRREYDLAFQHLIYPMLDDRTCEGLDPHPFTGDYIWTRRSNSFGWASLLGQKPGSPSVSPYAAPARAEDLSGLPSTYIATGALDLFLEEDLDYARQLMRHGVAVELHVYPGAFHAFDLAPDAAVAVQARRDSKAALRRALYPVSEGTSSRV